MPPADKIDSRSSPVPLPRPNFSHLRHMTDDRGLWEHADHGSPRLEHGYCNDDNGRALVITSHERSEDVSDLAEIYLAYVLDSRGRDHTFRNRRDSAGNWIDDSGSDDSQGRALWGLGAMAARAPRHGMEDEALEGFESGSGFESPHLRANAYVALGAAELIETGKGTEPAFELLDRTTSFIAGAARSVIPWPETRLSYDNARIPQALIAAGVALEDERRTTIGMRLMEWLVAHETNGGHFSFTPVGGRSPGDREARFDQQPIETWAMADTCHRAFSVTGDSRWRDLALRAGMWLFGANDSRAVMYDEESGGTYDGLTPTGVNLNQGAESTLAGLGTLQIAASLQEAPV